MGWLALVIALVAALAAVLPLPGMFVGMGMGVFAIILGAVGYRRRHSPSGPRLASVAGVAIGALAFVVGTARYALTLAAVSELENLF